MDACNRKDMTEWKRQTETRRGARFTAAWSGDDWEQWVGFCSTIAAFGVGFLACWTFS